MSKEASAKVIQVSSSVLGLASGDASSQAKLVDEAEDENAYDNVSYRSMDVVEEETQEQKEDKPKTKKLIPVKPKLDEVQITDYIKANISQRKCCCFLSTKETKDLCQCGLSREAHDTMITNSDPTHNHGSKQKWDADTCTVKVPVDSFGMITFEGFGQEASRKAPYIRVDHLTDTKVLWELLKTHWKIPEPKLIISITGGAKRLFIKSRLMNSFRRGLINAVTAAEAWIVTGGTNTGVMEIVGDAVHDYMLQMGVSGRRIVVLGIATWGYVANKASLTVNEINADNAVVKEERDELSARLAPPGLTPDTLSKLPSNAELPDVEKLSAPVKTPVLHRAKYQFDDLRSPENQGRIALNPFHSHFILVDNGTDGKPGFEINLRANLEQHIAQQCQGQVVLLVLEGGEKTLETASEAIDRDTPVVIIKGSGRAADVIAYAYYKYKALQEKTRGMGKDSEEKAKRAFDEEVTTKASKAFDWEKEKDPELKRKRTKTGMKHLKNILGKTNLVVIYNLDDSNAASSEMDQAILKALLQAQPNDTQSQLGLALAWNCCDVARQEIFSIDTRLQWQRIDLDSSMHTALVENKVDFAQLFMDSGVNLRDFLTIDRLKQLYYDVLNDDHPDSCTDILKNLISEQQRPSCFMWCRGNRSSSDEDEGINLETIGDVIIRLTSDQQENIYKDIERQSEKGLLYPERELFYFSLLLGRKEMAMQFWRCGRDHIGGALTANVLWRNLAQIAENEEELDLQQELESNAQEFESIAVGVLNQCYQIDKQLAHMLLTRELDLWGNRTLFMIADEAAQMDFMEQSGCQTHLNKSWTGRMAAHTPTWKIAFGLFFITIPFIKFSKEERKLIQSDQDLDNQDDTETGSHFYLVGLVTNERKNIIGILKAIYLFLMAPLVKFCYYALSMVIYLGLFSYFLLTNLRPFDAPDSPGACEIIVWVWTLTMAIEEIRQVFSAETSSISSKLAIYFDSVWNQFDVFIYLTFTIAFILRCTLYDDEFEWARIIYTIVLLLFFIRLLQFFFVHKDIGPKVIIIRGMLTDLLLFILLLAIFIVSYGIAARALMYPNATPSWNILLNVLYEPYFQLYGAINTDEALGVRDSSCGNATYYNDDPTSDHCPRKSWMVMVVLSVELLLTNILLLNLLIAMFSYTFSVIQENSAKVWRYYRYSLIYEYYSKPVLAPPLILLSHVWRFGWFLYHRCSNRTHKSQHHFKRSLLFEENKKLTAVERAGMENHMIRRLRTMQDQIDFKVSSTSEKIEKMIDELEQLKEQLDSQKDARNLANSISPSVLGSSISIGSNELSKLAVVPSVHNSIPSITNDDFTKETRGESSTVHSRLDRQDEMLNRLLALMAEGASHKQHHKRQQVRFSNGGGGTGSTEHLPKVDS